MNISSPSVRLSTRNRRAKELRRNQEAAKSQLITKTDRKKERKRKVSRTYAEINFKKKLI